MLKEASQYDAKVIEQNIQKFWDEIDAYSRVRELRKNGKKFFFGQPFKLIGKMAQQCKDIITALMI